MAHTAIVFPMEWAGSRGTFRNGRSIRPRANTLGLYRSSRIAASTRLQVASFTSRGRLITRETVLIETFASLATSSMDAGIGSGGAEVEE